MRVRGRRHPRPRVEADRTRRAVGRRPGAARAGARVRVGPPRPRVRRLARHHRRARATFGQEMEMVQDTFRAFATDVIAPHAEHVHRTNGDVPEEIVTGLAELGAFGLSVPADYGGFSEGGADEYLAMVIATEELSRASLGIGGSLITRPEILTRALVKGGTEEQKLHWLPKLATAEVMPAVAVTEPDFGSDVAGIKVTAAPADGPGRRGRLRDQRRQDVVHVRRPRRRARAPRPHRPRPLEGPPRSQPVRRAQGARRRPRVRAHPAPPTSAIGSGGWRAARSTRSATAACTPTSSPSRTGGCRPTTSSAATTGWARASTCRWPASRTVASRPPHGRSA